MVGARRCRGLYFGRPRGACPRGRLVTCLQWRIPPTRGYATALALVVFPHAHLGETLGPVVLLSPTPVLPATTYTSPFAEHGCRHRPGPGQSRSFTGSDWVVGRHARGFPSTRLSLCKRLVCSVVFALGCPVCFMCDRWESVLVFPCQVAVGQHYCFRHTPVFVTTLRNTDGTANPIRSGHFRASWRRSSSSVRALTYNSWPGAPPA